MFTADSTDNWNQLAYWMRSSAFEHCSEALMILDPIKNAYIDCNQAALTLLGFEKRDILELPISQLHGRELGQLIVFTDQALTQGQARSRVITCRLSSGEYIPIELNGARLCINRNNFLIVTLRDIRAEKEKANLDVAEHVSRNGLLELKYLQTVFQQGERKNLLMLSAVGDGIYCVDTEGLCTFINPAAKRLLGRKDEEVLGQNIHYVHHHTHEDGSHYPVEQCPIYAAIRDGIVHEGVQELFWKHDGTPFPVEFTSTPIISDSTIVGAVVVFRDISLRLETDKKLHCALDEIKQLKERLEDENAYLQQEFLIEQQYHGIIGESAPIQHLINQIELVAQTSAGVLITGESGTGKELIARAIHEASDRSDKALIRVNCAAIPQELFESEFFGHVRGAFTGALRDRVGRFELASQGTIFLDEVGEIPLPLQSKLLRVLQEGQLERVGEEKTRDVDVRVIAATNRDLKKEVAHGRFREDLYFRLNIYPLHSPPLRERGDDVTLLARHFIEQAAKRNSAQPYKFRQSDLQKLKHYQWPGNIRELQNIIERAMITSKQGKLIIDLPNVPSIPDTPTKNHTINQTEILTDKEIQTFIRNNIQAALNQCNGKLFGADGAAKLLGIKPTTLASRVKKFNLKHL